MKAGISTQISQSETGQDMLSTTRGVRDRMALLSSTFERVVRGDSVEGEYKRGEDALEGMLLSEGEHKCLRVDVLECKRHESNEGHVRKGSRR